MDLLPTRGPSHGQCNSRSFSEHGMCATSVMPHGHTTPSPTGIAPLSRLSHIRFRRELAVGPVQLWLSVRHAGKPLLSPVTMRRRRRPRVGVRHGRGGLYRPDAALLLPQRRVGVYPPRRWSRRHVLPVVHLFDFARGSSRPALELLVALEDVLGCNVAGE